MGAGDVEMTLFQSVLWNKQSLLQLEDCRRIVRPPIRHFDFEMNLASAAYPFKERR